MKVLFANMAAHYPVAELHACQRDNFTSATDTIVVCDGSIRHCNVNPFGRQAICRYCVRMAEEIVRETSLRPIYLSKKHNRENSTSPIPANRRYDIWEASLSGIASLTRCAGYSQLNHRWRTATIQIFKAAIFTYGWFSEFINEQRVTQLYLFNGRFPLDRAARLAAVDQEASYVTYDFKKNFSYYCFSDVPLHQVDANTKKALQFYLENPWAAAETAEAFIEAKRNGVATYERSYTELQQRGRITCELQKGKRVLSIFPSSDDEYRFLSSDWGVEVVKSQPEEISNLLRSVNIAEWQVIIRLHPNMADLPARLLEEYTLLETIFPNVFVLPPTDATSTYKLLDTASVVVAFCSTVAVEASYLRKPVVCIGGAPYAKLPLAHYVSSGLEAAGILNTGPVRLKPRRASIIWMNYLWKFTEHNRYIKPGPNLKTVDFLVEVRRPRVLRTIQSVARLEIFLARGAQWNRRTWASLVRSIIDILSNSFNIKN
jgi:hypothetical protein